MIFSGAVSFFQTLPSVSSNKQKKSKERNLTSPASWRYVKELFETTSEIEMSEERIKREGCFLNSNELTEFLQEESSLPLKKP